MRTATTRTSDPTPPLWHLLPPRWARHSDPERGVLVAAVSGPGPGGIRAAVLLAVRDGPARAGAVAGGTHVVVEENDVLELGTRDVGFLRSSALVHGEPVVVEEWSWALPCGSALVLRCSASQEEYPALGPLFATLAHGVVP